MAAAAHHLLNSCQSEKDLTTPQVAKQADQLVISGPLGTNRTCLSKLDSLGVAAVRLAPEARSIDICSADKEFFGTIQVLGSSSLNWPTSFLLCKLLLAKWHQQLASRLRLARRAS